MKKSKKKSDGPMMRMPGALLWLLCAPAAIVASAHYDTKKSIKKRKARKAKKDAAFRRNYPEYDWWQDDQGL